MFTAPHILFCHVNKVIWENNLPPESTTMSTPSPPVSSISTDSRSEEPSYTGITLAFHTNAKWQETISEILEKELLFMSNFQFYFNYVFVFMNHKVASFLYSDAQATIYCKCDMLTKAATV